MNIEDQIKVMQHYTNGGEVEYFSPGRQEWVETKNPVWNWSGFDYRIKEKQPVKPSINWDHVSKEYNWLAVDKDGLAYLFGGKPSRGVDWFHSEWVSAFVFASLKPGDCDWRDSLICRPGFEDKE